MLPARARLRKSSDFAAAVRRGPGSLRAGRRTLVLHAQLVGALAPGPSEPEHGAGTDYPPEAVGPRAGFVVSRAVGPAVVRNRVKRRLRHLLRARLAALPDGVVLVVRANPAAASATSGQLAADLDGALRTVLAAAGRREEGGRA